MTRVFSMKVERYWPKRRMSGFLFLGVLFASPSDGIGSFFLANKHVALQQEVLKLSSLRSEWCS